MKKANRNKVYVGMTGSGKNMSCHEDMLLEVVGQHFSHYCDFRGTGNTNKLLEQLWGRWPYVIVDDLTQEENVLPLSLSVAA